MHIRTFQVFVFTAIHRVSIKCFGDAQLDSLSNSTDSHATSGRSCICRTGRPSGPIWVTRSYSQWTICHVTVITPACRRIHRQTALPPAGLSACSSGYIPTLCVRIQSTARWLIYYHLYRHTFSAIAPILDYRCLYKPPHLPPMACVMGWLVGWQASSNTQLIGCWCQLTTVGAIRGEHYCRQTLWANEEWRVMCHPDWQNLLPYRKLDRFYSLYFDTLKACRSRTYRARCFAVLLLFVNWLALWIIKLRLSRFLGL